HPASDRRDDGSRFSKTLRITNTSATALRGPLALVVKGLPSGVSLANSDGTYQGSPYVNLLGDHGVFRSGESVMVTLVFSVTGGHRGLNGILFDLDALLGI